MQYRILFFGVIFNLCSSWVFAQERNLKVFNEDNGLPSSTIYSVFQDSKGYLWFGTDRGISKYDGYYFTNYTVSDGLADNEVFNFFEDFSGRIWFYSFNGKISYYYHNKFYCSENEPSLRSIDSKSMITSMFEDSTKNLWISTYHNGIIRIKDGQGKRYFTKDDFEYVSAIFPISNDILGMVTQVGVKKIYFKNDSIINIGNGYLPKGNIAILSSKIARVSNAAILFEDMGAVYKYSFKDDSIIPVYGEEITTIKINNICELDSGEIWICTSKGVFKYLDSDDNQKSFTFYARNYNITSILKDTNGNYWISTLGNGVLFLSKHQTYHYSKANGLFDDNVSKLGKGKNLKIWFTYKYKGAGYIDSDNQITNINFGEIVMNDPRYGINNILMDNHTIWIAANAGLIRIRGSQQDIYSITTKDVLVYNDSLLLGCANGVYEIPEELYNKIKNTKRTDILKYRIKGKRANKLFMDSDYNLLVASQNELLFRPHNGNFLNNPIIKDVQVTDIVELNKSQYMISTNGSGLYIINNFTIERQITVDDGLSSNICSSIEIDDNHNIWIATNNGLDNIINFPDHLHFQYYKTFDGLSSNIINDVLISHDTVWVATNKGIDYFKMNGGVNKLKPPQIQIESIAVNGIKVDEVENLNSLTYNQNDITINYVGIELDSDGDISYRYKLSEQASWKYTNSRILNYSSLSPGIYTFFIAAKGKSDSWSKAKHLTVNIAKPFWQTYWFITISVMVMVILVSLIVRQIIQNYRLKSVQKQKVISSELKSLKAQINPHFVFNALNSIQGELLKKQPEIAINYMGKLGRLMRKVLDHSERHYVEVSEEVSIITDYLDTEKFKTGNKFEYSIDISPEIDQDKTLIPSMIIQPFIENSIWHGFTEKDTSYMITIHFNYNDNYELEVKITDNGIGRKRASKLTKKSHKSKGLEMVNERLEALNYGKKNKMSFSIEDLIDQNRMAFGTCVILKIPQL